MSRLHSRLAIRWASITLATIMFVAAVTLAAGRHDPAGDAPGERAQPQIDFARDIEPIFKQDRTECHGPTKARARLRLHSPDTILKGGLSGAPIEPGRANRAS